MYINYKYFVIDDCLEDFIFVTWANTCILSICDCILRIHVFILLLS